MDTKALKEAIYKKINSCNDEEILLDVLLQLTPNASQENNNEIAEPEMAYGKKVVSQVPDSHYKLLEEDWKRFKNGELEVRPWEEVRAELREKHGF